jgi:hypothetical protein
MTIVGHNTTNTNTTFSQLILSTNYMDPEGFYAIGCWVRLRLLGWSLQAREAG